MTRRGKRKPASISQKKERVNPSRHSHEKPQEPATPVNTNIKGTWLCPVCRNSTDSRNCCGHYTSHVQAHIWIPAPKDTLRWKLFLRRFPKLERARALPVVDGDQIITETNQTIVVRADTGETFHV